VRKAPSASIRSSMPGRTRPVEKRVCAPSAPSSRSVSAPSAARAARLTRGRAPAGGNTRCPLSYRVEAATIVDGFACGRRTSEPLPRMDRRPQRLRRAGQRPASALDIIIHQPTHASGHAHTVMRHQRSGAGLAMRQQPPAARLDEPERPRRVRNWTRRVALGNEGRRFAATPPCWGASRRDGVGRWRRPCCGTAPRQQFPGPRNRRVVVRRGHHAVAKKRPSATPGYARLRLRARSQPPNNPLELVLLTERRPRHDLLGRPRASQPCALNRRTGR